MPRDDNDPITELAGEMLAAKGAFGVRDAVSVLTQLAAAGMGGARRRPEAEAAEAPVSSMATPAESLGERQLRRVEARYRALVEQIPAVVFLASVEGGENDIYVSPQIEGLLGFTQEEWTGNPVLWFRQLHPDDRVELSRQFAQACLSGQPFRGIVRVYSRDGRLLSVHAEASLVRDEAGRPLFLHGVGFDVTEQQQAQQTHQRLLQEQAARAAAEGASQRASFLARVSKVLGASFHYEAALEEVARLLVPEIADWSAIDLVQPDGSLRTIAVASGVPGKTDAARRPRPAAPYFDAVRRVVRTGKAELVAHADDHSSPGDAGDGLAASPELPLKSYVIAPMGARGVVLGALSLLTAESPRRYARSDLGLAEDLAQRMALAIDNARLYREAHEASRLKDEFLATLSHELRTPLNAIVGWAHILRETTQDDTSPKSVKAVDTILRNAQVQNQLISDILDVSRIIAGKMTLNLRAVDLAGVIQSALDTVQPAAKAKEIQVVPILDVSAGPVSADPDRLQQVMWNLLSNAIKFAPKKGRVEVRLEAVDSQVHVTVEDNGPGIDPTFIPFIFDRFRQEDSSSSRRFGGLGLGLAIVRHLVELHGGTVEAANREDRSGAVFRVRLPRRSVTATADSSSRHPAAEETTWLRTAPTLEGIRVLVVDDQPDARELVSMILERCGAETTAVATVAAALDALGEAEFDVLLADIEMPDEDGYQLIRRVRKLPPERGGRTPAAALTAYASSQDRVKALQAGFQMHVPKPVQPAELAAVVASLAATKNGQAHG